MPFSTSKYFYSCLRLSNLVDLSFEYLSFSNKQKTTTLFPSPLTFLQWAIRPPRYMDMPYNCNDCRNRVRFDMLREVSLSCSKVWFSLVHEHEHMESTRLVFLGLNIKIMLTTEAVLARLVLISLMKTSYQ